MSSSENDSEISEDYDNMSDDEGPVAINVNTDESDEDESDDDSADENNDTELNENDSEDDSGSDEEDGESDDDEDESDDDGEEEGDEDDNESGDESDDESESDDEVDQPMKNNQLKVRELPIKKAKQPTVQVGNEPKNKKDKASKLKPDNKQMKQKIKQEKDQKIQTPVIKKEKGTKSTAQKQSTAIEKKSRFEERMEKAKEHKGKSLYIRFPKKLPIDPQEILENLKQLCPLTVNVRRPRQPSVRYCIADFDSAEDCTKAIKELRKVEVDGKKLIVQAPKVETDAFIEEIIKRRKKKLAENRARKKLNKSIKQGEERAPKPKKVYSSTINVRNIPINASVDEIKNHFPNAIEFKLNYAKKPEQMNSAVVTLPTPKDATLAKRTKISIGETKLILSFAGQPNKNPKKEPSLKTEDEGEKAKPSQINQKSVTTLQSKIKSEKTDIGGKNKEKRKADGNKVSASPQKKFKRDIKEEPVDEETPTPPSKKFKPNKSVQKDREVNNSKKPQNQNNGDSFKNKNKNQPDKQQKHKNKSPNKKLKIDNDEDSKPKWKIDTKPSAPEEKSTQFKGKPKLDYGKSMPFTKKDKLERFQGPNQNRGQKNGRDFDKNVSNKGFQGNKQKNFHKKGEFNKGKNFAKKGNFRGKPMRT